MILVKSLEKEYYSEDGRVLTNALRGIDLEIKSGDFLAIMGPSGSGKSTLLHILSFLDRPTKGTYHFLDREISELSDEELASIRNKKMGFVFQAFNLLGRMSVYENIEIPLMYSDTPADKRKNAIERVIKSVDLMDKIGVDASKLSGGQKQRIAIARALVNDPAIIFADEPTGNLDSKSGAQIMEIFKRLNDDGRTVILVTHETYTANYAGRVIHIKDGMIEKDSVQKNKHSTKNNYFK